jgi:lipid A oxidase
MRTLRVVVFAAIALAPMAARAEFQISAYGGVNTANNSDVTLNTPLVSGTYDIDWYGDSFHTPPYWGVRGTWWLNDFNLPHWGVALDYTHAKVKAAHLGTIPFSHLEFTDGLNTAALNALYRMPLTNRFTAYAGVGAGVAFPHVEVRTIPDQGTTWNYQVSGPTVQGLVGINMDIAYGVSVFAEYKANFSWNDADLVGGGTLKTDVLTHQFAAGISISLGAPPHY